MKKKVLICVPDLGICNGVTSFIMAFYDSLIQHGYNIDFLLVMHDNVEMEPYVLDKGSKVFKVPIAFKYDKKRTEYIDEVFRTGQYDMVHVNFPGPNGAMVLKAAIKYGVKYRIYHCHNPINDLNLKALISENVFTPICRNRANKYVACSKMAGKSIFKDKEFEVINNAIMPEKFLFDGSARERIREHFGVQDKLVIGVAGRITDQKNPGFILDIFDEIHKMRTDAVLLWVGDGERLAFVNEQCQEKGIQDSVLLVGRQSNVREWYSAMDIFLLPSKFEGLGIVYLEAQANGLLCFGSDKVPEETEVTDLMHRLSLRQSAKEWAIEILEAYEKQPEKHCVDISLFAKRGFDINQIRDKLFEMYESCFDE